MYRIAVAIVVTALFVTTQSAFASSLVAKPAPVTAEARLQLWLEGLQDFVNDHPELSAERASAVLTAIEVADVEIFRARPGIEEKARLGDVMNRMRLALSCTQYSEVVANIGGVYPWLIANKAVVAGVKCNCGGSADDCVDGYECKSIECTSTVGTRHWGVCTAKEVEPEPVPDPG